MSELATALVGTPSLPQRRALAKAITLMESTRPVDRLAADELLTALLPHTGKAIRVGISGVPGVGKSTFIEALGLHLIGLGHRVAVLAVDPSSTLSGGSILGDKTRMEQLSVHPQAFIRPSPSSGTLGGVAAKTREALLACEAAGYSVVLVETVGVGQSETAVASMTDMLCLLQLPNAGDELQAIKRGVMELADLVAINKADIDPDAATRAQAQIVSSLRLLSQHGRADRAPAADGMPWMPEVIQLSALKGEGVERFWAAVLRLHQRCQADGSLARRRQQQASAWMWDTVQHELRQRFERHTKVQTALPLRLEAVNAGRLPASSAARQLMALFESPA